ncbi:MAG TPA: DUF2344 domain-containing protein [Candidatus Omnitrophica bacterium]|nr:MAG: hypothetical protein DRP61_00285 [Candidatus Omnitrophota bacterium]RKY34800.1 MAG: hypothetical protein DRP69_03665 [Candidatus Omnitrophota bacterium]RKY44911.1 MAG: hypothetical protein DRP80_00950 [Candidatus Omnitrophota bacterium]HEC68816.1 DUF2344 domain-containing protein [Candidatus Omnitrophota bacterium]
MERFSLRAVFRKEKTMIFLSHLDIYRLLLRALRRSGLPLFYSSGFNPHPKISMGKALKLGQTGETEVIFYFKEKITPDEFRTKFFPQIPEDLKILKVEELS